MYTVIKFFIGNSDDIIIGTLHWLTVANGLTNITAVGDENPDTKDKVAKRKESLKCWDLLISPLAGNNHTSQITEQPGMYKDYSQDL